jgi:hypothetical protein
MELFIAVPEVDGRVLDLGIGASVLSLLPVNKGAREIVVTGFLETERVEMRKWLQKDPDAFEWDYWLGHGVCC